MKSLIKKKKKDTIRAERVEELDSCGAVRGADIKGISCVACFVWQLINHRRNPRASKQGEWFYTRMLRSRKVPWVRLGLEALYVGHHMGAELLESSM